MKRVCTHAGCDLARRDVRILLGKAERAKRLGNEAELPLLLSQIRAAAAKVRECEASGDAA